MIEGLLMGGGVIADGCSDGAGRSGAGAVAAGMEGNSLQEGVRRGSGCTGTWGRPVAGACDTRGGACNTCGGA